MNTTEYQVSFNHTCEKTSARVFGSINGRIEDMSRAVEIARALQSLPGFDAAVVAFSVAQIDMEKCP